MNNLMNFNFNGAPIRVVAIDGDPWFVAKDAADMLGYANPQKAVRDHCKAARPVGVNEPFTRLDPQTTIIPERDVYRLVMRSKLPAAEKFEEWVVGEVIPPIRKPGGYSLAPAHQIPKTFAEALRLAANQAELIERQQTQLLEQKPMVTFAETCLASKDSILVRELAKVACKQGIQTGEKRLYQKLREWNLIMQNSTEPYQRAIDAGYFEVQQRPVETPYGTQLSTTTKVTLKGQVYIIKRLKSEAPKAS